MATSRFDRLVSIAEASKAMAAELPSPDGYNWFRPWANLLTTTQLQAQQIITATRVGQAEIQVSSTAEEQIRHATERLNKWLADCRNSLAKPNAETTPERPAAVDTSISSPLTTAGVGEWSYYVAEGGNDRLGLELSPTGYTTNQTRLIALPLTAVLLVGTIWLMRLPAATDFIYRWPHALGILFGIAYWAWLWPSWLGLLIVAGSLWLALRFDWPGRSLRAEASTVLRAIDQHDRQSVAMM